MPPPGLDAHRSVPNDRRSRSRTSGKEGGRRFESEDLRSALLAGSLRVGGNRHHQSLLPVMAATDKRPQPHPQQQLNFVDGHLVELEISERWLAHRTNSL